MVVGFDLTPAVMSRAGTGRYPRELVPALERRNDVSVRLLAASMRRPDSPLSRVLQGVFREGVYYPLALARRSRRAGVDLVHCPASFSPRVRDLPW